MSELNPEFKKYINEKIALCEKCPKCEHGVMKLENLTSTKGEKRDLWVCNECFHREFAKD